MTLLTPREESIAAKVAENKTVHKIARELGLSYHTVRGYINRIAYKIPGRGKPMQRIALWWEERKRRARRVNEGPGTPDMQARRRLEAENESE